MARLSSPTSSARHDDLIGDVRNLLATAWAKGFFIAALCGLAATFFSRYRTLRNTVGLARYDEAEFLSGLRAAGFTPARLQPNMGFDQRRMAFRATLGLRCGAYAAWLANAQNWFPAKVHAITMSVMSGCVSM